MAIKVKLFLHIYIFFRTFAARNPTKGCLHIGGGFSRHIKKAFIALCSDSMKCRKFQTDVSGLSNDRCPTGYRIVPLVPIWYVFCVYSYAHTRTLTMVAREYILYSAWASRCRFKHQGNATAS